MAALAVAPTATPRYAITFGAVLKETDDRQEYEKLVRDQYKQYKPLAEHEMFFVQELADAMWRLRNAKKMEARCQTIEQLEKVAKYIGAIERTYRNAYNELKKINAERTKASGHRYPLHADHHTEPDWTGPSVRNEPKPIQNEPTSRQLADLDFMLSEFRKSESKRQH